VRLEWSDHAVADLTSISQWIEHNRSLDTANRVVRSVYDACQTLRHLPFRGRAGRLEGTRELVVPRLPYLVVYEVHGDRVMILSVVHGAQKRP
jgi:toxin ParE1/3/4